jgi:hypothetical protein
MATSSVIDQFRALGTERVLVEFGPSSAQPAQRNFDKALHGLMSR